MSVWGSKYEADPIGMRMRTRISYVFAVGCYCFWTPNSHFPKSSIAVIGAIALALGNS